MSSEPGYGMKGFRYPLAFRILNAGYKVLDVLFFGVLIVGASVDLLTGRTLIAIEFVAYADIPLLSASLVMGYAAKRIFEKGYKAYYRSKPEPPKQGRKKGA